MDAKQVGSTAMNSCLVSEGSSQATLIVYTRSPWDITTIRAIGVKDGQEVMTTRYCVPSQIIPDGNGGEIYASIVTLSPGNYAMYEPARQAYDEGCCRNPFYGARKTTLYADHITEDDYYLKHPRTPENYNWA